MFFQDLIFKRALGLLVACGGSSAFFR